MPFAKEVAEFTPYVIINPLEICYKKNQEFICILTICKEGNKDNCSRKINYKKAIDAIDSQNAIVIPSKGWISFSNGIAVKCEYDPEGCRNIYKDYKEIDKDLIIQ